MKFSVTLLAYSALSLCSSLVSAQELSSRLSKFHSLASKNNGVVPLTSATYDELIHESPSDPREYSVSVILTALNPKFGCQPCVAFDKEHKEAARQWWARAENRKSKEKQMRHIFAVLDFEKGQDIFKRVWL
jgi:oligosaccharyltransferase complex subunit gamma